MGVSIIMKRMSHKAFIRIAAVLLLGCFSLGNSTQAA